MATAWTRPGGLSHNWGRSTQALTNPEDRRLGRQGDAGPGTPSAPPHEGKRPRAAGESQTAYAPAATERPPAFAGQNCAESVVAGAKWMSVKAEAVSPLCLDVVNDAVAVPPHKEGNAAIAVVFIKGFGAAANPAAANA